MGERTLVEMIKKRLSLEGEDQAASTYHVLKNDKVTHRTNNSALGK